MAETQPELKKYRGNCHCGAFVYEMEVPELKSVMNCNCSVCDRKAYLWVFPGETFRVVKGDEKDLTEYVFGPEITIHKFCPTCGVPVMAVRTNGPPGNNRGINARTIQGLNVWDLETSTYDGKAIEPAYQPPEFTGPKPTAEVEGGKLYTGSCHCGAVKIAVLTPPLDETYTDRIVECNCSICIRNGYVWIYIMNEQVVIEGRENLSKYKFNNRMLHKTFCKTCGVQLTNEADKDLTEEEIAGLSEGARGWLKRAGPMTAINVRALEGVDIKGLKTQKADGFGAVASQYQNP